MKSWLLMLLSFSFLTSIAFARLGETPEQLEKRFGPPDSSRPDTTSYSPGRMPAISQVLNFAPDGWWVSCNMINGTCAQISYTKKSGSLTEEQITTILKNETQGSKWSESVSFEKLFNGVVPFLKSKEWTRPDGVIAAQAGSSMTLTTPAYNKALEATKQPGVATAQKTPGNS